MAENMGEFLDFAEIRNYIERHERERTYGFNMMLVGSRKIGKSTLVRSLTQGNVEPKETDKAKLNEYSKTWAENGVKLKLHCIETSRYDQHNVAEYVDYLESQYKAHFKKQIRQSSWSIEDTRIHCCLYMIPPDNELVISEKDLTCMLALHERVNLVPVIANADKFNALELAEFKENIMVDLKKNGIKYFEFQHDVREDEERFQCVKVEADKFPFAVIATNRPSPLGNGKEKWIRQSCNGPIDIWDREKSDFPSLAKLLFRHCMLDLIDSTHTKHYAEFKKTMLDEARRFNGKNLQELGLHSHEIKRIMYKIKPGVIDPDHLAMRKQRAEMESELATLTRKLESLQRLAKVS